jgi:hypothetical protein
VIRKNTIPVGGMLGRTYFAAIVSAANRNWTVTSAKWTRQFTGLPLTPRCLRRY